jgi:RNA polymerase primary sigma factor
MSKERHAKCGLEIEAGVVAQAVLDGEWDLETDASTEDLVRIAAQGKRSLKEMIEGNLRLALYWATRYSGRDQDYAQDLFQEAYTGLVRAIEGWDPLRGYQFSTYATWHIRQSIVRSMNAGAERTPVHIPVHVSEEIRAAKRENREPNDLGALGLQWQNKRVSWEAMREQADDLPCPDQLEAIEEIIDRLDNSAAAACCLASLRGRESLILKSRFGLSREEPQTLEEIGARLGITRERVRQLESNAIRRLRLRTASMPEYRTAVLVQVLETDIEEAQAANLILSACLDDAQTIARVARLGKGEAKVAAAAVERALLQTLQQTEGRPRLRCDLTEPADQ